ncbi:OadG family protein [Neptunomonas antarctica]|uniref:Probable oxaloacetate decarboxylase gamma chain n=1 Tax=Neptunomonas antarctica TaxID=619304 RepID=A0A1N7JB85_9GAMM|nr:OadG family protein [Neptunomonas antarctica]SIS46623.1 oxaloacetate decarboxylase, gamma subunit [Neptunomonas antarctica]
MDNLLSEGLTLMVFGMGFVFMFLTLLVVVTTCMSKLVVKYGPAPQLKAAPSRAAVPVAAQVNSDELVAVITAAVHKYRS